MIRKANKKDMDAIVGLWEEMMKFHAKLSNLYELKTNAKETYHEYLNEILKNDAAIILVYEMENRLCGYLIAEESELPLVYKQTRIGSVLEISVTEKHQNKDIGSQLLKEIEKIFISKGIDRIECMVSCFNEISKKFWFKNGFKTYNMVCFKNI